MDNLRKILILLLFSFILSAGYAHAEITFTPIINTNVIGGQYVFISSGSTPGSLGYNLNTDVTPAISFGDVVTFLPTVSFNYYGIKDVTELVGESTVFEQRQDLLGSGKLIFHLGDKFSIKGGGSYKIEYLKETPSETWGSGLFDYTKLSGGGEIEAVLNDKGDSIRGGYNYYQLNFSNYEALIEKYGDEFKEFLQTPGAKVLDYNASEIFAEGGIQFADSFMLSYNFLMTLKAFPDQFIIDSLGAYSATDKRDDITTAHNVSMLYAMNLQDNFKVLFNIGGQLSNNSSDQNHYDVGKFQYIANYYGYSGFKVSPTASIQVGNPDKPIKININTAYGTRAYTTRLAQDVDGNYLADLTLNTSILLGIGVSYPITKEMDFKIRINYFNKTSNMKYESFYKYNYTTINYFGGISFEF